MYVDPTFQLKHKYRHVINRGYLFIARKNKTLYDRALRTTIWQKIVDAFRVLGGSSIITIRKGKPGERSAIYPDISINFNWDTSFQLGLTDYTPLLVLRLLFGFFSIITALGFALWDVPENDGNYKFDPDTASIYHVPYNKTLFIIRKVVASLLIPVGLISLFVISNVQAIVTIVLTLLSLPIVGIMQWWSQNQKEKIDRNFVEKYEQQYAKDDVRTVSLKNAAGHVYKHGPMKDLLAFLNDKSIVVQDNIEDAAIHTQSKYRIVLFSKQGQTQTEYYFYQFTYDQAGREAYAALREFNPDLCKSTLRAAKEEKMTEMFQGFSTLKQGNHGLPLEITQKIATHVMDDYKNDKTADQESYTKVTQYPMSEKDRWMILDGSTLKSREKMGLTLFSHPAQPKEKSLAEQHLQVRLLI